MKLNRSKVVFDPIEHTYTLDGVLLQGVTGMIKKQLFPDKYKDIPNYILQKAAERGTLIHEQCEMIDIGGKPSSPEGVSYLKNCFEMGLSHVESEYLVSDEKNFASCIDKVMKGEGYDECEFDLGDIKTTSELDKEYVSWQLSIYAYLFELNNPKAKVKRLIAMWLRGDKSEFAVVERKPTEVVKELLLCEAEGRQFENPYGSVAVIPEKFIAMQERIIEIDKLAKQYKEQRDAITNEVKGLMSNAGVKKWDMDKLAFTIKADTERESFDTKAFQRDYPEIYEKYLKKTKVSGSIILTIKKETA